MSLSRSTRLMRLFLAVNLPTDLRRRLSLAAQPLRDAVDDARWVHEEKIHLTLKFLGDVDEDRLPSITGAVDSVACTHAVPVVKISGAGAFPSLRRPNVIWMGVEPDPRLELLHHDVEVAFDAMGFELEGRPFRPHITIGRLRARPDQDA